MKEGVKTLKKLIVLCMVICLLITSGCMKETEAVDGYTDGKSMFVKIESGYFWMVVYHRKTKVMYAVSESSYNCGNFTMLVIPDGTPMLYEGDE